MYILALKGKENQGAYSVDRQGLKTLYLFVDKDHGVASAARARIAHALRLALLLHGSHELSGVLELGVHRAVEVHVLRDVRVGDELFTVSDADSDGVGEEVI